METLYIIIIVLIVVFLILMPLVLTHYKARNQDKQIEHEYSYEDVEDLIEQGDYQNALIEVNERLKKAPKDYVGLYYRHQIYISDGYKKYLLALSDLDSAIKYAPQEALEELYRSRAALHEALDMPDKMAKDLLQILDFTPTDIEVLIKLIEYYVNTDCYNEAEKFALKLRDYAEEEEILSISLVTLGIVTEVRDKNYKQAINHYDNAIKCSPDNAWGYFYKARMLYKLEQYKDALDQALNAFKNGSNEASQMIYDICCCAPTDVIEKMNILINEQDHYNWHHIKADSYINLKKYDEAIEEYLEVEDITGDNSIYGKIVEVYEKKGDYRSALWYANQAITMAINNDLIESLYITRARINLYMKNYKDALSDCNSAIEISPMNASVYGNRAMCYYRQQQFEKALADLNKAIGMGGVDLGVLLARGILFNTLGKKQEAIKDFERVIGEIDKPNYCTPIVLFYLNRKQEAIDCQNKIYEKDQEKNAYDAARLYSLMNDQINALKYLEIALKSGEQQNFYHIDTDIIFADNIRNTAEFKALIKKYDNRDTFPIKQELTYIEKTTVVKLTKSCGTFEMPCEINGLKLSMCFDSGASDVTINSDIADFMLKNNYLHPKYILGTTSYIIADGSITEGTVINLKEIKVGDCVLKNIRASIVHNQNAPLLLGQTVLKRFANITIDNEKMELVIKYKEVE